MACLLFSTYIFILLGILVGNSVPIDSQGFQPGFPNQFQSQGPSGDNSIPFRGLGTDAAGSSAPFQGQGPSGSSAPFQGQGPTGGSSTSFVPNQPDIPSWPWPSEQPPQSTPSANAPNNQQQPQTPSSQHQHSGIHANFHQRPMDHVLISFRGGSTLPILQDLSRRRFQSRAERSSAVYNALTQHASRTQANVLKLLNDALQNTNPQHRPKIISLWVTNQIAIEGCSQILADQLRKLDDVAEVRTEGIIELDEPNENSSPLQFPGPRIAEWNLIKIQAPEVWSAGFNGNGITVANIDTGVRFTHEILRSAYKNDGHSWFDPYEGSLYPSDQNGHGSHTMGTIVGGNGYGVAPGAKWIACKGLDDTNAAFAIQLIQCGQFLICPTDPYGNHPDCTKTPHIVSNSWGTGITNDTMFDPVIGAWHAAGIVPVFAIGNFGPNCSTAAYPADSNVISVGATNFTDRLAHFSSRGPDRRNIQSPDLTAPGQIILSASNLNDNEYKVNSGTSMACPHVAGTIALMLQRNTFLEYNEIKSILERFADQNLGTTGEMCEGIPDNRFPNHHFGYGRINALKAVKAVENSLQIRNGYF